MLIAQPSVNSFHIGKMKFPRPSRPGLSSSSGRRHRPKCASPRPSSSDIVRHKYASYFTRSKSERDANRGHKGAAEVVPAFPSRSLPSTPPHRRALRPLFSSASRCVTRARFNDFQKTYLHAKCRKPAAPPARSRRAHIFTPKSTKFLFSPEH